jgi:hypothetical protein
VCRWTACAAGSATAPATWGPSPSTSPSRLIASFLRIHAACLCLQSRSIALAVCGWCTTLLCEWYSTRCIPSLLVPGWTANKGDTRSPVTGSIDCGGSRSSRSNCFGDLSAVDWRCRTCCCCHNQRPVNDEAQSWIETTTTQHALIL